MQIDRTLLTPFPKERPELPEAYKAIYVAHYIRNRSGASPATSIARKMESWMHRKVAEDVIGRNDPYATLEIGSGSLNHLEYEPSSKNYEVVEPFVELYANSPHRSRLANAYQDLKEVGGKRFDRIISIAAFEHLCELPVTIARSGLLLAPAGQLRVAVPSEGTILWEMGWRLTTGIEFRLRHGLDYGVLMRHEHLNRADEISGVLKIFFKSVRRSVFGICPALSFYQFFQCTEPDTAICATYLDRGSL